MDNVAFRKPNRMLLRGVSLASEEVGLSGLGILGRLNGNLRNRTPTRNADQSAAPPRKASDGSLRATGVSFSTMGRAHLHCANYSRRIRFYLLILSLARNCRLPSASLADLRAREH